MSGFEIMPVLQAMGATAGGMGVQKAGQAVFGGGTQSANQAPPPAGPGGMQQPPAASILAAVQQQMQQEEQRQQQALAAFLASIMQQGVGQQADVPGRTMSEAGVNPVDAIQRALNAQAQAGGTLQNPSGFFGKR